MLVHVEGSQKRSLESSISMTFPEYLAGSWAMLGPYIYCSYLYYSVRSTQVPGTRNIRQYSIVDLGPPNRA